MSLLSSFIQGQLLKAIEAEFVAHEPDMQQALVSEVAVFADDVMRWVSEKLQQQTKKD